MNNEHECIIGLYYWHADDVELITLPKLKKNIVNDKRLYEEIKYDPVYALIYHGMRHYTLKDYADKRKSTNLHRFEYCPVCGKKIDWKKIGGDEIADSD